MRSALVGCCAAALALVAPRGVGAQSTNARMPSVAEQRLCRDTDILVCSDTGGYADVYDLDYLRNGVPSYTTSLRQRVSDYDTTVSCSAWAIDGLRTEPYDPEVSWQCHPPQSSGAILPGIPAGAQVTVVDYKHFAANDPVGIAFAGGVSVLTAAAKNATTGTTGYYFYEVCDGFRYVSGGEYRQVAPPIYTFSETELVEVEVDPAASFGYTTPFSHYHIAGFCSAGWTPQIFEIVGRDLTYSYGPPTPTAGELAYAAVYGELFDYSSLGGGAAWLTRTTSPILGAVRHANDRDVKVTLQRNSVTGGAADEVLHLIENQTSATLTTTTSFADSFACTFAPAPGADDPFDYFVAEPSGRVHGRVNGTAYDASEFYVNNPFNENTTYACTCVLPPSKQYTDPNKAEFEVCVIVAVTPESDRPTLISFNRGLEFATAPTMCGGTATAAAIAISSSSVLPDEYRGVRLSCIMPYTVPTFTNAADRKRRGDSERPVANLASKRMEIDVFGEIFFSVRPDQGGGSGLLVECNFPFQAAVVFTAASGWELQPDLCFPAPLVADQTAAEAKCGSANGAGDCTLVSVYAFWNDDPPFVACACAPPPPLARGRIGSASNSNSNSNSNTGGVALVALVAVGGVLIVGGVIGFSRTPKSSDEYTPLSQAVRETRM